MFIGRKKELQTLDEMYNQDGFSMTVIYGRRRIGKSTLISEFIKDKKAIFYTATKIGKERNLELFSEQVMRELDNNLINIKFSSLEDLFDYMGNIIKNEKIIIVIDELPYWAEKDESLLSVLQKYIDTKWLNTNIKLILCGSILSFMEKKVLSEKSPLFGRRTSQIKLEPFDYNESSLFVPDYSYEDKAIIYGITGGVAKYLSLIDSHKSVDYNIKKLFFNTDGYLYEEPRNLLIQEFSDITLVNSIVEQIASGENTLNIIAGKIGESDATVLYSLEKLISVGIVEKKKCITEEKNKKKTQYVLKDLMFKFWYMFIPNATSIIEVGRGNLYYDKVVKKNIHLFMGSIFENMCRYYILKNNIKGNKYNYIITKAGTWWGVENISTQNNKKMIQSADIDVVGLDDINKLAIVGECKFKNEKIDKDIYETLIRRSNLISSKYRIVNFVLFSLSGYTNWFKTLNDDSLICLTIKDLYEQVISD